MSKALPVIITAGLCDTFLIVIAILGVSLILISMPTLQLFIYIIGFLFLMYMAWSLWTEKPSNIEEIEPMSAKKADFICFICFFIKSSCNNGYCWCYRNECFSL
ncbi:LysE family transporter [Staphylococcus epidermidis]